MSTLQVRVKMTLHNLYRALLKGSSDMDSSQHQSRWSLTHAYPPPFYPTQPTIFVREQKERQQGVGKQKPPLLIFYFLTVFFLKIICGAYIQDNLPERTKIITKITD